MKTKETLNIKYQELSKEISTPEAIDLLVKVFGADKVSKMLKEKAENVKHNS